MAILVFRKGRLVDASVFIFIIGAFCIVAAFCSLSPAQDAILLTDAELVLDDAGTPPESLEWAPVTLPDKWRTQRPAAGGSSWYRLRVPASLDSPRVALYLPTANSNAQVFIGHELIGSGGRFEVPAAHNWNRPLFYSFSPTLLETSGGTIYVRLLTYPHGFGELGPVWVGPAASLEPVWSRHLALSAGLAEPISLIGVFTSLSLFLLWRGTRDPLYGWGMASSVVFTLSNLNYHLVYYPVSHQLWESLTHLMTDTYVACLFVFSQRLVGANHPRRERLLWAWIAVTAVALQLAPIEHFYTVAHTSHGISLLWALYTIVTLVQHRGRLAGATRWGVIIAAGGAVSLALLDMMQQIGLLSSPLPRTAPLILGTWCIGLWLILSARFIRSFNAARMSAMELEELLREREDELAEQHARNLEMNQRRILDKERNRLILDLHDGIGGELVLCLSHLEAEEFSSDILTLSLQQCLDDLRIILDSLDPTIDSLALALGSVRERIEPRLRAAGVALLWQVDALIDPPMAPDKVLHLTRWIQEAITNALKHAKPATIRFQLSKQRGSSGLPGFYIEVCDGGNGFAPQHVRRGRGLSGMQARAAALRGQVVFARSTEGQVGLWFPDPSLDQADKPALSGLVDR